MKENMQSLAKPILSLCMIVKNEKENLPRCLARAQPYVDEIIVVDTGSQDGTPEIALQYGAKVYHFEWCDDFAAARNYSIAQASSEWILVLDADEELVVESDNFIEQLNSKPEIIAYKLSHSEVSDYYSVLVPLEVIRLFRNCEDIKYIGRYHEYPSYQNQAFSEDRVRHLNNVRILHYGYNKEQVQQKHISRNIPILERIRQEEGLSLMLLFCLARMYVNTQQPEKAQECYAEAFERLLPNLLDGNRPEPFVYIPTLIYFLGRESLAQQDYETTRLLCQRGLEWCPNYPPLNSLAAATLKALGFPLGAAAYYKNCMRLGRENRYYKSEPFDERFMTTFAAYDLGCLYMEMGRAQNAIESFELALKFDENYTDAQEKIDLIKNFLANRE